MKKRHADDLPFSVVMLFLIDCDHICYRSHLLQPLLPSDAMFAPQRVDMLVLKPKPPIMYINASTNQLADY